MLHAHIPKTGLLTADSDTGAHLHVVHVKPKQAEYQEHLIPFPHRTTPDHPSAEACFLPDLEIIPLKNPAGARELN